MSKLLNIFDTETTGLPIWGKPSGGDEQPHIVQLAAILIDEDTQEIKSLLDIIVRPDGWTIPQDTIDVHGITQERAMDEGVPEKLAVEMFLAINKDRKRVAFNTTFDNRIIRIALKRYFDEETQASWKAGEYECAMLAARKAMALKKNPKLADAYKHFIGSDLSNAHSAMPDTLACMDVYFAIKAQHRAEEEMAC